MEHHYNCILYSRVDKIKFFCVYWQIHWFLVSLTTSEWISLLDVLQKESFSLMLWISQIFDTESNWRFYTGFASFVICCIESCLSWRGWVSSRDWPVFLIGFWFVVEGAVFGTGSGRALSSFVHLIIEVQRLHLIWLGIYSPVFILCYGVFEY